MKKQTIWIIVIIIALMFVIFYPKSNFIKDEEKIEFDIEPLIIYEETLSNQAAFCEHMRYKIEISITDNIPYCVFEDDTICTIDDFYKKNCGLNKIKDIAPRKNGESVYLEFEKCEQGLLISEPEYLLDTYHCYKPFSIIDFFKNIFWD